MNHAAQAHTLEEQSLYDRATLEHGIVKRISFHLPVQVCVSLAVAKILLKRKRLFLSIVAASTDAKTDRTSEMKPDIARARIIYGWGVSNRIAARKAARTPRPAMSGIVAPTLIHSMINDKSISRYKNQRSYMWNDTERRRP
jgi:hypothetical protein